MATNYQAATSTPSSFVITSVVPDPVTIINKVPGVRFQFDWTAARDSGLGGSAFVGYKVEWALQGAQFAPASTQTTTITGRANTTYGIAGLTANSFYEVRVTVLTASSQSAPSNTVIGYSLLSPGQPISVTAAQPLPAIQNPGVATISWTAPTTDGGTPITGYTAEALIAGNLAPTGYICTAPTGPNTCTIYGLNGTTLYVFRVNATNRVGTTLSDVTSPLSVGIVQTITVTPPLGGVQHSTGAISLLASSSSGMPLSYRVTSSAPTYGAQGSRTVCSVNSSGVVTVDLAGTCIITVSQDGMDAQHSPTYYAAATSVTTTITVLADAPSAVQNILADSGNKLLSLTWSAPISDGGAPIVSYDIVSTPLPSASPPVWTTTPTLTSATAYVLTNLLNGTNYDVTVRAKNAAGLTGP